MALINIRNALMTGKRLPYDAEVEFLESTGTQWIDTGVVASQNIKIEARFYRAISPSQFAYGVRSGGTTICCATGSGTSVATMGYARWGASAYVAAIPNIEVVVVQDKDGVTVNGTHYSYTAAESVVSQSGYTIALFAAKNSATTVTANLSGKFWYCKIWDNGVLVRDYIPVRVGTTGYLYDRVTGELFGNAGTGDFVLGPDVVPVEWLQSAATTYINTVIIPDDTYGMEVTGYTTQTVDSAWIGTRNSLAQRCFMGYSPSLGFYYGWNGRQDIQYTTGVWSTASMNLYNSRKNMMDGTEVGSISETLGAQDRAIYLFGLTANGTLGLKLKSALITKGSDDVLKLVSVRVGTGSTWEGAMMDTLTRRIYRNQGTGAFGYGNDLKYPIPA